MASPADSKRATHVVDAVPSDIRAAQFLGNPVLDNLVSVVIATNTEVWALRRRLKVLEAVLAQKGVTNEMIEKYVPTPEQEAAWQKDRDRFIDLTLSPLADPSFRSASADFPAELPKR
jgi:hypothetical protein